MKILLVSDVEHEAFYTPQVRSLCEDVELVISCGDLPAPYLEYILTMLDVPLLYVPGNHDRPRETGEGRWISGPEGGISVDGRVVDVKLPGRATVRVAGLGGSMFYGGTSNQYTERQMRRRAARLARRLMRDRVLRRRSLDILVTHAPPLGIHDGKDRCHTGFGAFLRLIRRYRPRWLVHGHVHPSYGYDTEDRLIGGTAVLSVYGRRFLEI